MNHVNIHKWVDTTMITVFWMVFSAILAIAWSIPFIIMPLVGLRFYILSDSKVLKLIKRLPKHSSIVHNDDPEGWLVGYPFIGYLEHSKGKYGEETYRLFLLTTIVFYTIKMKEINSIEGNDSATDSTVPKKTCEIVLYDREGCYAGIYYTRRTLDVQPFTARPNQSEIIDDILKYYEVHRNAVVVLHGEKGVGKSMIPILLTKTLAQRSSHVEDAKVGFCDTHKPTDPGDYFHNLYQRADPTRQSPLIVVFEEFDGMIHGIHHLSIRRHDDVTTSIYDKSTWNQFFDRFDRGYFPWTLLILTTNQHPDSIHRLDESYLRKGRVNLVFEVKES